jgi:hypothetical protein
MCFALAKHCDAYPLHNDKLYRHSLEMEREDGAWYPILLPGGTEESRAEVEYTTSVQRYFLDSVTLLAILSRQKRSGTLSADHVYVPSVGGNISISIVLEYGMIRDCLLFRKQNVLLHGKDAYYVVETLPALEWLWKPLPASPAPLSPPLSVTSPAEKGSEDLEKGGGDYPQRTAEAQNKDLLQRLSRRHRQALSLCDGTRSLSKIAAMLSISPQVLSSLLDDLKGWGCIRFRQEF